MTFEELYNVLPVNTTYYLCDQLLDEYMSAKYGIDTYCPIRACEKRNVLPASRLDNNKEQYRCTITATAWNTDRSLFVRLFGLSKYYKLYINDKNIGTFPEQILDSEMEQYLKTNHIKDYKWRIEKEEL